MLVSSWGQNLEGIVYKITSKQKVEKLPLRAIKGCADIFYAQKNTLISCNGGKQSLKNTK